MITHDDVTYEYGEAFGLAFVHIDGKLWCHGDRKHVMWAMFDLPLLALLKLSIAKVLA